MIEIHNVYSGPFWPALNGMRNSFKSWDKSDSIQPALDESHFCENLNDVCANVPLNDWKNIVGEADRKLIANLLGRGEPHCKFLRQIPVTMDITAPLYWWKQMDTYKVGTTENSTSTMHTIMSAPLTDDDFSFESCEHNVLSRRLASSIRVNLNTLIREYECESDHVMKEHLWNALIQLLPEGYNQMRTWSGNYSVLRNIHSQRSRHKLREWREFCKMVENLPLSFLITAGYWGGTEYADIER